MVKEVACCWVGDMVGMLTRVWLGEFQRLDFYKMGLLLDYVVLTEVRLKLVIVLLGAQMWPAKLEFVSVLVNVCWLPDNNKQ